MLYIIIAAVLAYRMFVRPKWMHVYNEKKEAVRTLHSPVLVRLPTYGEAERNIESGDYSALDSFIIRYQPHFKYSTPAFRADLENAIQGVLNEAHTRFYCPDDNNKTYNHA